MSDEELLPCPYNKSHIIMKSRMQAHLVKCKQNYPLANKMICPFNAIHHVDKPDYQYHVSTCPDRRVIEGHVYEMGETDHGDLGEAEYFQPDLPTPDEDWDAETPVAAYNPLQHVESSHILRMLPRATKSQRKAFRNKERQRIQKLMDGEDPKVLNTSSSSESQSEEKKIEPLRRPHHPSEALLALDCSLGLGRGMNFKSPDRKTSQLVENYADFGFGRGSIPVRDELPIPIGIGRGKLQKKEYQ